MQNKNSNRWFIAIMGTLLQVVLGTVYAWSFFQKPIMVEYGWTNVQTMWIFSIAILFLGLSAAVGGMILPRFGPRKLATIGAILYGVGYLISAYAMSISSLPLFYLGFGVVGGIGLGLGYVTPVATASKWFPDKKGFITGMVVMGFGIGALIMSKIIAPIFIKFADGNMVYVFIYISIVLFIIGIPAGLSMKNPPNGFIPKDYIAPEKNNLNQEAENELTLKQSLLSSKFIGMWLVFFLNISAGIMFVSMQSPMIQDLFAQKDPTMNTENLAVVGATLIAISSLFNGIGRFLWGGLSDRLGRIQVFRLILGSQILVFILLIFISNPYIFGALVCYILLCYGGGFGAMPSYILDIFHEKLMPVMYGVILTAWSFGGIVGPQVAAFIRDFYSSNPELIGARTYITGALFLGIGFIITLQLSNKSITSDKKQLN
ncbi:OFA family MFS transporter [Kaistella flava (ex Peng et al. 2021)]|uniref:OFA family MFS transporter n=1 Tax=Kaistella flava (ex Peng et al. 2021) TaxID=2038776 RepID=A0A7M2YA03_9FLAO|nr:OFA family MFS transporter [Kaistella flava (ex Peng et al. 2021)]QOW10252.1 OFA family MFS transporter [Kaistella flava (ex Peng et al. 2021)]